MSLDALDWVMRGGPDDGAVEIPAGQSPHVGVLACRLVLITLAEHADVRWCAWPSQRTIARETGLERRQVQAALHVLEQLRLIVEVQPAVPRSRGTTYELGVHSAGDSAGDWAGDSAGDWAVDWEVEPAEDWAEHSAEDSAEYWAVLPPHEPKPNREPEPNRKNNSRPKSSKVPASPTKFIDATATETTDGDRADAHLIAPETKSLGIERSTTIKAQMRERRAS